MVELTKKAFIIILVAAIGLTSFAFAVALNIGGLGDALQGAGGPIAAGLYNIIIQFPIWTLSGGWPTLGASILIVVVLCFISGYNFEQKHVIATIRGSNVPATGVNGYNAQREPEEPERAPTATKV